MLSGGPKRVWDGVNKWGSKIHVYGLPFWFCPDSLLYFAELDCHGIPASSVRFQAIMEYANQ